jgi:transposase
MLVQLGAEFNGTIWKWPTRPSIHSVISLGGTADAEAICEAVTRANMRFVATKTPEQQSCLMLHRTRHLFIRSRPQ